MADPADRPNVLAPPPLVYVAALIAGYVLQALFPLRMPLPSLVRWTGAGVILVSLAFGVPGRVAFARAGTEANPFRPSTALVTSGPYRFSRNPMYVGMTGLLVGLALITRIGWLLILLVPVLGVMHWGVVRREERYLEQKFGDLYRQYRCRVRRYI